MEPITIAVTLGKLFAAGTSLYLRTHETVLGLEEKDLEILKEGLEGAGSLREAFGAGSKPGLVATHAALITRAFGTAFQASWHGDERFAPSFDGSLWKTRLVKGAEARDRQKDVQQRLTYALTVFPRFTEEGPQDPLSRSRRTTGNPLASPMYRALWHAFTDPSLESDPKTPLLDLEKPGARLAFERAFVAAYGEELAGPGAAPLRTAMSAQVASEPALLRERLLLDMAAWGQRHVFAGDPTPGVPFLPLEATYVEPNGEIVGADGEVRSAPLLSLVRELLGEHPIVIIEGDFGHGKSLSARVLACEWARRYLTAGSASPELVLPIFAKCARDLFPNNLSLSQTARRATKYHAEAIGVSVGIDDPATALPGGEQATVFLIDGLDEVHLGTRDVEELFRELRDRVTARHRVLLFSRPAALSSREAIQGIPTIRVSPFSTESEGGQVAAWLERWNVRSGKSPLRVVDLRKARLLDLAGTPILLFMVAMTWEAGTAEPPAEAQLYERFLFQLARGKCEHDREKHPVVYRAAEVIEKKLKERGDIGRDAGPADAMMWLFSRIAWEERRCARRLSTDGNPGQLDIQDVEWLLRHELEIREDPQTQKLVCTGALLALQSDLRGGQHPLFFGHKSFREFLVARYWAVSLERIAMTSSSSQQRDLERRLFAARLMEREDRSFDFLMEVLAGPSFDDPRRIRIRDWAADAFADERIDVEKGDPCLSNDQRYLVREAMLAVASTLSVGGERVPVVLESPWTLRSLLAAFWLRGETARVVAPGLDAHLVEANLEGANLFRASLEGANLFGESLEGANLFGASLGGASLGGASLFGASLFRANLEGANLFDASLFRANLEGANLFGANLFGANLKDANLKDANLFGANLKDANFKDAILPEPEERASPATEGPERD